MLTKEFEKKIETTNALRILQKQAEKNSADGIPLVALHTECALKFAKDALDLLAPAHTVGTIHKDRYALYTQVGTGKTDGGKEFDICVQLNHAPFIRYGRKTFNLTWADLVELAERAGLFEDEMLASDAELQELQADLIKTPTKDGDD